MAHLKLSRKENDLLRELIMHRIKRTIREIEDDKFTISICNKKDWCADMNKSLRDNMQLLHDLKSLYTKVLDILI